MPWAVIGDGPVLQREGAGLTRASHERRWSHTCRAPVLMSTTPMSHRGRQAPGSRTLCGSRGGLSRAAVQDLFQLWWFFPSCNWGGPALLCVPSPTPIRSNPLPWGLVPSFPLLQDGSFSPPWQNWAGLLGLWYRHCTWVCRIDATHSVSALGALGPRPPLLDPREGSTLSICRTFFPPMN